MDPRETLSASEQPPGPETGPGPASFSIGESVSRLVDAGRDLVAAELDWAKLRGRTAGLCLRDAALLGLTAIILALATLTALLVGLIMILTPALGAALAVLIVTGTALALAGLLGWLAARRARAMFGG
jgi:hypothetical protein